MSEFRRKVAEFTAAGAEVRPLSGGDLSQVLLVRTNDGWPLVAKQTATAQGEAAMLRAIRAAGVAAPEVVEAAGDMLLMRHVAHDGEWSAAAWADIGSQLRRLHGSRGERYGWSEDYAFGEVPIRNGWADDWPAFWGGQRLIAVASRLGGEWRARVEELAKRLCDLVPRSPTPSLLHGDLWGGNILVAQGRLAALIDPACYYGHSEVDLAMLTLFGAPAEAFWTAYGSLESGWEGRRHAYQLFPALVHLRLFGAAYTGMVDRLLRALGA